jgi:adenosine deaminase
MAAPWLLERVRRRPAAGVATLEALRARLAFRTFDEFIERWVWKCGFLDRYEDFESLAESVLADLAAQGVVHVEPSISPGDYEKANALRATGVVAFLDGAARERLRARVRSGWAGRAGAESSSIPSRPVS